MTNETTEETSDVCVLYNGECPICATEIAHYEKLSNASGLDLRYDDLNNEALLKAWQIDSVSAAKELHVRKNGEVLKGVDAFLALWAEIPRYQWLSRFIGAPVVYHFAKFIYAYLLAPILYGLHVRRQKKRV